MAQGTPPWRDDEPPTPCPRGCGHSVHWNPCEAAETPRLGDPEPRQIWTVHPDEREIPALGDEPRRSLRDAAFAVLEQLTQEFGWQPDAPAEQPLVDDPFCCVTRGALKRLSDALDFTGQDDSVEGDGGDGVPVRSLSVQATNKSDRAEGVSALQQAGEPVAINREEIEELAEDAFYEGWRDREARPSPMINSRGCMRTAWRDSNARDAILAKMVKAAPLPQQTALVEEGVEKIIGPHEPAACGASAPSETPRSDGSEGCKVCLGERWVCENHAGQPWNDDGCMCGAGMPCAVCNPWTAEIPPAMPPGVTTVWCCNRGEG